MYFCYLASLCPIRSIFPIHSPSGQPSTNSKLQYLKSVFEPPWPFHKKTFDDTASFYKKKLSPVEVVDDKNVIVQVDSPISFQDQNPNTEGNLTYMLILYGIAFGLAWS